MWYHKKVKSMVLLPNEEFGYFGKWRQKSAALKQSRKKMRCTCMQLSPSVNCLSVSLAIELSLLHFICNENAKESCLALSSSLTDTNSEAHGGAPPSAHILGFSVKPPSRRSLSPCSSPASFAHCSLASQPHGHGCQPQPLRAEIPFSSASPDTWHLRISEVCTTAPLFPVSCFIGLFQIQHPFSGKVVDR